MAGMARYPGRGKRLTVGLLVMQNADNLAIGYTVQAGFDESLRELYDRDYREHDLWTRHLSHMAR